jgi:hypothetical protein
MSGPEFAESKFVDFTCINGDSMDQKSKLAENKQPRKINPSYKKGFCQITV